MLVTEHHAPSSTQHGPSSSVDGGVLGDSAHGRPASAPINVSVSDPQTPLAASEGSTVALRGTVAGGTGTILTSTPQGNALTPAIVGLLSRQGVPPTAYRAAEGGYDVQGTHDDQGNNDGGDVSWAELQPVAGGAIAANNAIDQAIQLLTILKLITRKWKNSYPKIYCRLNTNLTGKYIMERN